ncbi:hypothetical protein BH24ACT5_BH24ACT5_07750 [soil metagenome]
MNIKKFAVALGAPLALIATTAGSAAFASAPPTTPPAAPTGAPPADETGLPPGYQRLVDDTGALQVDVPATWIDIDTAPGSLDDGTVIPWIEAAPDRQSFEDTFDTPGVLYVAYPYTADPQELIDEYGLTGGCSDLGVEPYDDGVFAGLVQVGSTCGSAGTASWNMVSASPADQSMTVMVQVHTASVADQDAFDTVLDSFNLTSTTTTPVGPTTPGNTIPVASAPVATVPPPPSIPSIPTSSIPVPTLPVITATPVATVPTSPTTPGATTQPSVTAPGGPQPGLPLGQVQADAVQLVDDSNRIMVSVPSTWTDIDTTVQTTDSGNSYAWISASPNLADFNESYNSPGMIFTELPATPDADVMLDAFSYSDDCTSAGRQPYDDGAFVGAYELYTDCGGTSTILYTVAVNGSDPSYSLFVTI